jgi:hypothetical protein
MGWLLTAIIITVFFTTKTNLPAEKTMSTASKAFGVLPNYDSPDSREYAQTGSLCTSKNASGASIIAVIIFTTFFAQVAGIPLSQLDKTLGEY